MNAPSPSLSTPLLLADSAFSSTTSWRFDAPIHRVWEAIYHVSQWPQWWRYVQSVSTVSEGDKGGLGAVRRFTWRSALPYTLTFDTRVTMIQAPFAIDAEALGDLTGVGRWRLFRTGHLTVARYHWDVTPTKPWMRWLAPYTGFVFAWNHERVMRAGEQGLARRLGEPLPLS